MRFILRGLTRGACCTALAIFFATVGVVFASPIGYSVRSDVDKKLYRIDMATGVATEIGATGFSKIEALAINANGEIYGVNPSTAQLVKCSGVTGACTAVGTLGGLPQIQANAGLAFTTNGALYLGVNAVIYLVDPATAATAPLGTTGPALSGLAGVAPSATCASGLYGMGGNTDRGKFYCINTTTGAATQLATLSVAPLDLGLDGDPTTGLVWGVTDDDQGTVFSVDPATFTVSKVSPVTLAGKAIGGFESLAVARTGTVALGDVAPLASDPVAVPAPTGVLVAALALLLATATAVTLRSRRRAGAAGRRSGE